jgi:ribosomal protein L23
VPGKSVRSYRNRGRKSINGQRSDIRKAYVTLAEGDKLPIFAAPEESKAPEKDNK